jgi:hypothetical protein
LLLAQFVQKSKFPVMVEANHKCVSACFLIFAAGDKRFASQEALIGVHSSYLPDKGENSDAKGVTLDLARIAHEQFDIPPSIIGRMVATPPDKVYFLNRTDLAEMGVQITEDPAVAVLAPQPASPNTIGSAAFKQGLADRTNMETWLSGLTGNFRAGALSWAKQQLSPQPGSCESGNGEFSAGCIAARYKLTPRDKLWKSNLEYQAGWNSYSQ